MKKILRSILILICSFTLGCLCYFGEIDIALVLVLTAAICAMYFSYGIFFTALFTSIGAGLRKTVDFNLSVEGHIGYYTFMVLLNFAFFMIIVAISAQFKFVPLLIFGILADKLIKECKVIKGKIKEKDVDYYRDIPCNGNLFEIYYIAYQYGIANSEIDLIGAILLKWIKEKRIAIIDNKYIKFFKYFYMNKWDNDNEKKLYEILYMASSDGILEKKEMQKWCNNHVGSLYQWFKSFMSDERRDLVNNQEILTVKVRNKIKYYDTEEMLDKGKKICGLKKFFNNYTRLYDREIKEVELFEEYLIVAQMLGVGKKINKQFKYLYPGNIEEFNLSTAVNLFIRMH